MVLVLIQILTRSMGSISSPRLPPSCTNLLAGRRIVEAAADRVGVDPTKLPPLYYTVDPEALDTMITGGVAMVVRFT